MKYRFLHLRRSELQHNIRLRAKTAQATRNWLTQEGFVEVAKGEIKKRSEIVMEKINNIYIKIETPTLFRPTPEGAKEFLVPTRHPKKFYSLPQRPQQYKQLLMASGFDRFPFFIYFFS